MRLLFFLLLLVGISGDCLGGQLLPLEQIPSTGNAELNEPVYFSWSNRGTQFTLQENGSLSADSRKNLRLKLPIEIGFNVTDLLVGMYQDEILVAYETECAGDGMSYICRINKNLKSLKWCTKISTGQLHVSTGPRTIWIGGIGSISRLDPETGRLAWQRQDLYGSYNTLNSFTSVCPIEEDAKTVTFDSEAEKRIQSNKIRIVVNRQNGKITKVIQNEEVRGCP